MINPLKERGSLRRMNAASLPVVDVETSLKAAFARIRRTQALAVITRKGQTFNLHTSAELARAVKKGKRDLLEVKGHEIHLGDMTKISRANPECYLSTEALLANLRGSGKRFALLSAPTLGTKHAIVYYAGKDMFTGPRPKDRCPICSPNACTC